MLCQDVKFIIRLYNDKSWSSNNTTTKSNERTSYKTSKSHTMSKSYYPTSHETIKRHTTTKSYDPTSTNNTPIMVHHLQFMKSTLLNHKFHHMGLSNPYGDEKEELSSGCSADQSY